MHLRKPCKQSEVIPELLFKEEHVANVASVSRVANVASDCAQHSDSPKRCILQWGMVV